MTVQTTSAQEAHTVVLTKSVNESEYIIRHVTIAHGRHRDNSPPERVRNRLEERILGASLREVNRRGE